MKHNHFGARSIDEYAYSSKLKNWNSSLKVLCSFIIMILSICSQNVIVPILIAVSAGVITVYNGKIHTREYLSLMCIPLVFLIMTSIAIMLDFNFSGGFSVKVLPENVYRAVHISCRAIGAVSAMYLMSLSTPVTEIIAVLGKLKLPFFIIELMNLMYKYIFILLDSQAKMKNSAAARLGYCNFRTSLKTFGLICGNLFAVSLRRASDYYNAIESRCSGGKIKFMCQKKTIKSKQVIFFVVYVILIILSEILLDTILKGTFYEQ